MADIYEQDLALKTTIADTDWMRLVTPTGNHRMTVGQFKDLIGYTQAKSDISQLQSDVASLVDSGSNPNGTYIKFSDGTMICFRKDITDNLSAKVMSEPNSGGGYRTAQNTLPYPATFYGTGIIGGCFIGNNGQGVSTLTVMATSSWSVALHTNANSLTVSNGVNLYCFAIGRWK